jgi:hypothetical protein
MEKVGSRETSKALTPKNNFPQVPHSRGTETSYYLKSTALLSLAIDYSTTAYEESAQGPVFHSYNPRFS